MISADTIDDTLKTIKSILSRQEQAPIPGYDAPITDPEAEGRYYSQLYSDLRMIASLADGLATVIADPSR